MDEPRVREFVTGLADADIETVSAWPALPVPSKEAASARLSFDALAKLFAAQRTSLIDADLTSVDTFALLSEGAPQGSHDE